MRITSLNKLTSENVYFDEAEVNKHGHTRIDIGVKNSGELAEVRPRLTEGRASRYEPLVIETPLLFSFGVQRSVDKDGWDLNGYSMPVCLFNDYKELTEKDLDFQDGLEQIEELCREHLENDKKKAGFASLLKSPLVEKNDKSPVLYPKLIFSKKANKIYTLFHSKESDKLNPLDYLDQYCYVKMSLIIDSIYISEKSVTIQIKVNDVFVKPIKTRAKLVSPPSDDEDEG